MTRRELDAYYTPDALAAACVARCGIGMYAGVVEPSVGGGAWVRALRAGVLGVHVTGIDIDPEAAGLLACNVSRTGGGSDTAEYALFIWRRGAARMQVSHLDWRK